jgi:hypothetical protein
VLEFGDNVARAFLQEQEAGLRVIFRSSAFGVVQVRNRIYEMAYLEKNNLLAVSSALFPGNCLCSHT